MAAAGRPVITQPISLRNQQHDDLLFYTIQPLAYDLLIRTEIPSLLAFLTTTNNRWLIQANNIETIAV